MLKLDDYKIFFVVLGLMTILLFASPTLALVFRLPGGERFSELWILGPNHMAENYVFDVNEGETHLVYVGIGNHMGSSSYYVLYVKLRNQTEPLPNATLGTPSPLQPLFEYRVFLQDGKNWEAPLNFSLSNIVFSGNQSLVENLTINNTTFRVDKAATNDPANNGYYYQLLIELWIYNQESDQIEFHNRFG